MPVPADDVNVNPVRGEEGAERHGAGHVEVEVQVPDGTHARHSRRGGRPTAAGTVATVEPEHGGGQEEPAG